MERVLRFGQAICILACVLTVPLLEFLQRRQRRAFAALFVAAITVTSLIAASVPAHLLIGRARKHLWARSDVYNHPKLIDLLPAGSVVVNATGQNVRNFELAGRFLTNKVITNLRRRRRLNHSPGPVHITSYRLPRGGSTQKQSSRPLEPPLCTAKRF